VIKLPDPLNAADATPHLPHPKVELSVEQKKMIKEVFHIFNTRNDTEGLDETELNETCMENEGQDRSRLDESDFAAAIQALGFSSRNHTKEAKELMNKVDTDGDHSVSLEEFTHLMEGQLAGRDPEEEINAIFAAFVNYAEDGCITKERLAEVTEGLGVKLTDDELNSIFDDAHRNSLSGIDKEEFVKILKYSTWI
jgi:Ca2+-binding EF-hand superfamily protein